MTMMVSVDDLLCVDEPLSRILGRFPVNHMTKSGRRCQRTTRSDQHTTDFYGSALKLLLENLEIVIV